MGLTLLWWGGSNKEFSSVDHGRVEIGDYTIGMGRGGNVISVIDARFWKQHR